jgi:2-polyprenyl-3-methyl-5-hydroxy-6-metoxy-1,4-benzoquinol methylase
MNSALQYDEDGRAAAYSATKHLPRWLFVEERSIQHMLGDVKGKTIMDAGCGSGACVQLCVKLGAEMVVVRVLVWRRVADVF